MDPDPGRDLAGALHEISNALTVLLGWADAARSMSGDPRALEAALDIVTARAAQARDIARRAIGGSSAPLPSSPVAAIVAGAALGLSMEAQRSQVRITSRIDRSVEALDLPSSPALEQILTNLLLNAIAFSPPGSTVDIHAEPGPEGSVLLHVDDQGPGVPPEQRDHIFEAGVTTRPGGAGIGLRHSAALAAQAGGELRLGRIDRGARFELVWPCAPGSPRAAAGAQGAAPARPARHATIEGDRILVVEDDDAVIELLELALEARGASVVSVRTRAELPAALESGRFDAALLDISPLDGDVNGALAELRRASPAARVVVMSGSVQSADVAGAAMWVRKPFEVKEIVEALFY